MCGHNFVAMDQNSCRHTNIAIPRAWLLKKMPNSHHVVLSNMRRKVIQSYLVCNEKKRMEFCQTPDLKWIWQMNDSIFFFSTVETRLNVIV